MIRSVLFPFPPPGRHFLGGPTTHSNQDRRELSHHHSITVNNSSRRRAERPYFHTGVTVRRTLCTMNIAGPRMYGDPKPGEDDDKDGRAVARERNRRSIRKQKLLPGCMPCTRRPTRTRPTVKLENNTAAHGVIPPRTELLIERTP